MKTNANSNLIAALLKDGNVGTFTGIVTTKVGVERGPKGAKVRYGDDTVHTVIFTGFKYEGLVERSIAALALINNEDILLDALEDGVLAWSGRGKKAVEVELTLDDIVEARAELLASFEASLDGTSKSTTSHVFDPLEVDGEGVRGGRVYKCVADDPAHECRCRDCTGNARAPRNGTINIQGLQISSKVIIPAVNGPKPASKSSALVVAKGLLKRSLPVSRYVSYRLEPGTDFLLSVGGTAVLKAEKAGFHFTEEVRDAIARVAA